MSGLYGITRRERCLAFCLDLGVRYTWRKGHCIESHGELLFLDKGQVRLTHFTLDGTEKILWYINQGCLFGETPLFDPMADDRGSVHICAMDCVVYAFSKDRVEHLSRTRPDLTLNLLHSMARKLRTLSNQPRRSMWMTCWYAPANFWPGACCRTVIP